MSSLSNEDKHLLFDLAMGLADSEQAGEARRLIEINPQADVLYRRFRRALQTLDCLAAEECPEELVEGTVWRLANRSRSGQAQLEQLLAGEQYSATTRRGFWPNIADAIATAAGIILVAGILMGPLNNARQRSWRQQCEAQIAGIWQGITNYSNDHEGRLPAVSTQQGAPWWKVGCEGKENHSNTRHLWLLVGQKYVEPADFVCPGKREGCPIQLQADRVKEFSDFPARRYITYSFRIGCDRMPPEARSHRQVLIADLNPIFEHIPKDYSGNLNLELDRRLLNLNSRNHNQQGQTVLFCDGAVDFAEDRHVGIDSDDIYTLRDTRFYKGNEMPSCETDAFLAP